MILGYGMQDPDNWDTDPWGRPVDPYQDEWDAIDKRDREKAADRAALGVGDPIRPSATVRVERMCEGRRDDPMHRFSVVYSGRYRCRRCGFDYEYHGAPGFYLVDVVHGRGDAS